MNSVHQHDNRERTKEKLLQFGATLQKGGPISGNQEADKLLRRNPFAFLVASCTDRGTRAEFVWELPWHLERKLEGLDAEKISRMTVAELEKTLRELRRKPRFPNNVARTIVSLAEIVTHEFGGDAARLWRGRPVWEVLRSLQRVYGVGPGIANMTVRILMDEGQYDPVVEDLRQIDIKPDRLVTRVFYRSGLSPTRESESCVEAARRLCPEFAAKLDWPAWQIGRDYCDEGKPKCSICRLDEICPKVGV